jgi:preprotein translocase subunit YajC
MISCLHAILLAQAPHPDETAPWWTGLVWMGFLFAIFYFVLIRPQQQMKQKQDNLIATAKSGDQVITSGGLLGTITNVKDKTFMIRLGDNVKVEILKSAIATIEKGDAAKERPTAAADVASDSNGVESAARPSKGKKAAR